jgi:hypothetical protein
MLTGENDGRQSVEVRQAVTLLIIQVMFGMSLFQATPNIQYLNGGAPLNAD